jgi:hypothetical protein
MELPSKASLEKRSRRKLSHLDKEASPTVMQSVLCFPPSCLEIRNLSAVRDIQLSSSIRRC